MKISTIKEDIIKLITRLSVRALGALLVCFAYNKIAYEFNLPTFSWQVFFCMAIGLRYLFKKF